MPLDNLSSKEDLKKEYEELLPLLSEGEFKESIIYDWGFAIDNEGEFPEYIGFELQKIVNKMRALIEKNSTNIKDIDSN